MDRTGPIWPPDELLGEDPGDGPLLTAPSAGDSHTPPRGPIAPVWLDANDSSSGELPNTPEPSALDVDDIRLTADDWLAEETPDTVPSDFPRADIPGFDASERADQNDWRHSGTIWGDAFTDRNVVEGSVLEGSILDEPVPAATTVTATIPDGATEPADVPIVEPVPSANSPWAAPPRTSRERITRPEPEPVVEPSSPAPGVYDVPSGWITPPEATDPRGSMLMRQITVVCRNANAGRAVARLLTITLQHDNDDAWARAAGKMRSESDFAHAGDLLARDQALTVIDAGPDVRANSWERAVDAADHLIVAVNAAGSGPAEAAALLDALAKSKHADLAKHAVTVVLMPVSRWGLTRGHEDVAAIRDHFTQRSHAVFLAPFDLRPTSASRNVWREIGDTVRAELPEI